MTRAPREVADLAHYPDDFGDDPDCAWCGSPCDDVCTCSLRGAPLNAMCVGSVFAAGPAPESGVRPRQRVLKRRARVGVGLMAGGWK